MKTPDILNSVKEFHDNFQQYVADKPSIPDESICQLRINLIYEELRELEQAIMSGDIVSIADSLCDLQYVLSGTVLAFGMGHAFHDLFNEVHRSNMSKGAPTEQVAIQSVEQYQLKNGEPCVIKPYGKTWLIYRAKDGKLIKPHTYSPANIKDVLDKFCGDQVANE